MASQPPKKSSQKPLWLIGAAVTLLCSIAIGYFMSGNVPIPPDMCSDHDELLIGYKLLDHILFQETQLKYLHVLRDVTLHSPSDELGRLIVLIHKTAKKRKSELKELRKLAPHVLTEPKKSKMGDSIQALAEGAGKKEMILPRGSFDMRFLFLQSQATRMIAAIAKSIAGLDCRPERVEWMTKLDLEFEQIRDQLVTAVDSCRL